MVHRKLHFISCPSFLIFSINWFKNTDAAAEQYVKLNVGGALFQTTIGTLTKHDTMLRIVTDSNGWVLIDRSGRHFGVILDFLRDGFVPLPECRVEVEQILAEARYYLVQVGIPQRSLYRLQQISSMSTLGEPGRLLVSVPSLHVQSPASYTWVSKMLNTVKKKNRPHSLTPKSSQFRSVGWDEYGEAAKISEPMEATWVSKNYGNDLHLQCTCTCTRVLDRRHAHASKKDKVRRHRPDRGEQTTAFQRHL
ncbi:unnamed protein product [Angiostrongylus costaricensis]|uniref:BTB domain-containing protein n=1 Tax=Angiostrongylus costaricensis TaxID=334426 RepID=A0A0R3PXW5_ANGCS|nr:unnamed protein product [Angiostrongylus costaricensis]